MIDHPFLLASLAGSIIFWLGFSWRGPSGRKTLMKGLPLGCLLLWLAIPPLPTAPILGAVFFALVGDIALSRAGPRAFLAGMAAFALAHVALILVFFELGLAGQALRWGAVIVVLAVSGALGGLLFQRTGPLRWPVLIYVGIIAAMALVGLAIDTPDPMVNALVLAGVALFVVSDALIGVEVFLLPERSRWRRPAQLTIWPTYYLAMVAFIAAAL